MEWGIVRHGEAESGVTGAYYLAHRSTSSNSRWSISGLRSVTFKSDLTCSCRIKRLNRTRWRNATLFREDCLVLESIGTSGLVRWVRFSHATAGKENHGDLFCVG